MNDKPLEMVPSVRSPSTKASLPALSGMREPSGPGATLFIVHCSTFLSGAFELFGEPTPFRSNRNHLSCFTPHEFANSDKASGRHGWIRTSDDPDVGEYLTQFVRPQRSAEPYGRSVADTIGHLNIHVISDEAKGRRAGSALEIRPMAIAAVRFVPK